MNLANWTTRFLVGNAQNSEKQPDGQGSESGSAERQVASAQPAASRSLVGSRVGPYLISKRLGEGGVGEVFKGVDVMLKREVAIKVLHHEFASDPLFVERFSREAQLHAQAQPPQCRHRPCPSARRATSNSWSWNTWPGSRWTSSSAPAVRCRSGGR